MAASVFKISASTFKMAATTLLAICLPSVLCLDYDITEETGSNVKIGNVLQDTSDIIAGKSQKFVSSLSFKFLPQGYKHTDYFLIDKYSGEIRTKSNIDRELVCDSTATCTLEVMVGVQSSIQSNFIGLISVFIRVLDINDNYPHFTQDSMTLTIPESVSVGTSYRLPSADDRDLGDNSIVAYKIDPNSRALFSIKYKQNRDKTFAVDLLIKSPLDREISPSHRIVVSALDGGSPPKHTNFIVNINVTDTNDHSPTFSQDHYTVTYREDLPQKSVLLTVSAHDKDLGINGRVYYFMNTQTKDEIRDQFNVNATSGEITLMKSMDYERHHEYQFVVEAIDGGSQAHTSQALVDIQVENINDNSPEIHFNLLSPVPENASMNHFIVLLMVTDADNITTSDVTCKINTRRFKLQQAGDNQYKLLVNTTLNHEHKPFYDVIISCKDGGFPARTTNKPLRINITDVNDNSPKFTNTPYVSTVRENCDIGTYILTVTATDEDSGDNGLIRYQLSKEAYPYFQIDSVTGDITTSDKIDRERKSLHTFYVTAADLGLPSLQTTIDVLIDVKDENDVTPHFATDYIPFYFPENENLNVFVGKVKANDTDIGNNSRLTYSIIPSVDATPFVIDPSNGVIYSADVYDREEQSEYRFKIAATDAGSPRLTGTTNIAVYISDINDNDPIIVVPRNKTYKVSYTSGIDTKIFTVKAYDRDFGKNSKLRYRIIKGNENKVVKINPNTGEILTARDLNEQDKGDFSILVEVTDNASPPRLSIATFSFSIVTHTPSKHPDHLMIIIILCVATICVACLILVIIFILRRRRNKHLQRLRMSSVRENGDVLHDDATMQRSGSSLSPYHKNCEVIRSLNGGTMSKLSPRSDNQMYSLNSPPSFSSVYTVDQHTMEYGSPTLVSNTLPSMKQQYDHPSRCSTPITQHLSRCTTPLVQHPIQYMNPPHHCTLPLPTDAIQMKQINEMLQRLDTHSDTSGDSGRGQSEEDRDSLQQVAQPDTRRFANSIQKPPRLAVRQSRHDDIKDKIATWMHSHNEDTPKDASPNRVTFHPDTFNPDYPDSNEISPTRVTFHPDLDDGFVQTDSDNSYLDKTPIHTPSNNYYHIKQQNSSPHSAIHQSQSHSLNTTNPRSNSRNYNHSSGSLSFHDSNGLPLNETMNDTVFEGSSCYTDNDSDTTTSGSYVVDPDQLVHDIDHMFFSECVV